jgi:hypothetical protein
MPAGVEDLCLTDDAALLSYWMVEELETDVILNCHEFVDFTSNDAFLLTPQFSLFAETVYIQIYYIQLEDF